MGNRESTIKDPYRLHNREASKRSAKIDQIIKEDSERFGSTPIVLVLGSSKSGKSTIIKQMKAMTGFSLEERITYRGVIYQNLLESAQAIISAMDILSIQPADPQNQKNLDLITDDCSHFSIYPCDLFFTEQLASAISELWGDPVIRRVMGYLWSKSSLAENATYFLADARRIGGLNYVPSDTDILRCWMKGAVVLETRFSTPGLRSIRMVEVGGKYSEQMKWTRYFEGVTNVLFCTALSEYDEEPLEPRCKNRMEESLELFDSVVNSRVFLGTSIILFLNKFDIFRDMLPQVPLARYFPEYTGGPDVYRATMHIRCKFARLGRARSGLLYQHVTQATDTANFRTVASAVEDTVHRNFLQEARLL